MSELPRGWVEATLGDLFDITSSKRVHQHEWTKEGVPFYRAREIKKLARTGAVENELFISEDLFEKHASLFGAPVAGDLMVTAVGTLGECYRVREEDRFYFKDASVLWLRKQTAVEPDYVARLFLSKTILDQVHEGGGTTVGTYTVAAAKGTVVPVPPAAEQRRIVAKIDSLFGRSRRARDHLDQIPRLIEQYKHAILAAAYKEAEQRSEQANTLGGIASEVRNGLSKRPSDDQSGVPILRISAVRPLKVRLGEVRYYPPTEVVPDTALLQEGDLLFTRYNGNPDFTAVCGMVRSLAYDTTYPDKLIRVRLTGVADPRFVELVCAAPQSRTWLAPHIKTAAGQHGISGGDLKRLPIPLPSVPAQSQIAQRTNVALAWIDHLASEATSARKLIEHLDQAVLAKAFCGELVSQDPSDEPASALVERIWAERSAETPDKRNSARP